MESRTSNVSSTPTPASFQCTQADKSTVEGDPWAPLVLSLDGGGVRGLSSLYILRRIMLRVRQLEAELSQEGDNADENTDPNVAQDPQRLPLPCHYFDNMVGTSTGGLIAVMLGRFRMDVNECIQQYFVICNGVFRPHRYLSHYDSRAYKKAINDVIRKYCKCHGRVCAYPHNHYLRQYDFLEFDDIGNRNDPGQGKKVNHTCKVAVITQRKAHGPNQPDRVFLMRSYNHRWRDVHGKNFSTLNLGQVHQTAVLTWQACRATSAAPFFFKRILINGYWYIDGGVGDNNPSNHAWNEAALLNLSRTGSKKVAALISIGTGMTEQYTKFGGLIGLVQYARRVITETGKVHEATRTLASFGGADYFRFDVRPFRNVHEGLSKIKLDECKRKKKTEQLDRPKRGFWRYWSSRTGAQPRPISTVESYDPEIEHILDAMDTHNDSEAMQTGVKGGYKPNKYDYTTFQAIKDLTNEYCQLSRNSFPYQQGGDEGQNVWSEIDKCAKTLVKYSQRRKEADLERWQNFRRHPDPHHEANKADPPREA